MTQLRFDATAAAKNKAKFASKFEKIALTTVEILIRKKMYPFVPRILFDCLERYIKVFLVGAGSKISDNHIANINKFKERFIDKEHSVNVLCASFPTELYERYGYLLYAEDDHFTEIDEVECRDQIKRTKTVLSYLKEALKIRNVHVK